MEKNSGVFSPRGAMLIYPVFYDKLLLTSGLAIVWRLGVP